MQPNIKIKYEFGLKYQSWTVHETCFILGWYGELLKPKHVKQTVKHDDSVMAWGCFSSARVGDKHIIEDIMNANMYIRILSDHMIPSSTRLIQGDFIFQHDNDPKHC